MLSALMSGNMLTIILTAFSILVMLFVVFPLHESAHALTAKLLGDDTAERQGRITLNPFAHLDLIGTIGIVIFRVGWAKPVPVNTRRCTKIKSEKAAMALTAAAGPMANVLSSLVFLIIQKILLVSYNAGGPEILYYLILALGLIIQIDLYNGVFNLLPIPPFDGSRVFFAFLPQKYYFSIMRYEQYIMIGLLVLMYTGILSIPFQFITDAIYSLLDLITKFIC
ncbi:MAG: site-2 protease family protein [Ruminiclostridium sp.]|nr:site-2 protease family protein [Ruminiclostridium sp.]